MLLKFSTNNGGQKMSMSMCTCPVKYSQIYLQCLIVVSKNNNFNIFPYFLHFNHFRHYVPFDIFYHSTFCPNRPFLLSTLCLFGVLSYSTFCPFDIFYQSTFCYSAFCPIRRFVVQRFFYLRARLLLRHFVGEPGGSMFRHRTQ
jgi:hypothetical protein